MASHLLNYIKESTCLDNGNPKRYRLNLKRVNLDQETDTESKLRRFTLGQRNEAPRRTVLLVGATGSGKSTLINAMVNYVMGVKFENKVWFEIISDEKDKPQADSQTTTVTVYDIFGFERKTVPYSLSIIDTPGYGDTRGIEHDEMVTKTIKDLFMTPDGVDTITAVGLVLKATENRLDERMVYIFNSITSLFGKDMEKNIVAMMTHSTGGKPKNALQALVEAKINCAKNNDEPVYFQFNNRQKETIEDDSEDEDDAAKAFKASNRGMKKFTDFLENAEAQSLKSTVEVLRERERLTACIQNAQERVATIEEKKKAIEHNTKELEKLGGTQTKNPGKGTVTIKTVYRDKEKINHWWDYKATTCSICKENCHYPGCTMAPNPSWCQVMWKGNCTSCTGKCAVRHHVKENWKWVTKTKTEEKDISELMNLEKEKSDLELKKKQALNEAFECIMKLEVIALNKDSVFIYENLEFLIKNMIEIGETDKIRKLEEMRNRMDVRNKAGADYYMRSKK